MIISQSMMSEQDKMAKIKVRLIGTGKYPLHIECAGLFAKQTSLFPLHGRIRRGRECMVIPVTNETDAHLLPLLPVASSNQSTSPTGPALKSEGGKEREKSPTSVEQIYRTRA